MTRVLLTPFVILGLLFLPSCSSAREFQADANCERIKKLANEKYLKATDKEINSTLRARQIAGLSWLYYIVQEGDCFSSVEVEEARSAIDAIISSNK